MSDFDLNLDDAGVKAGLREAREQYSTRAEFRVDSDAEYSFVLEFGRGPIEAEEGSALRFENEDGDVIYRTSVSGHPPYPFVRPAIRELKADPEAFLVKNTEFDGVGEVGSGEELVEAFAAALASQMKTNATASASGRSPGTDPDHPQVQSGNLRARISFRRVN